jgi:hypothetical protein
VVIRKAAPFSDGEGRMAESYSWLFVENVPLLCNKESVARQLKVETWLDLAQLLKELKGEGTYGRSLQKAINYVV